MDSECVEERLAAPIGSPSLDSPLNLNASLNQLVNSAMLGWPRCPECGEWAVPMDEWPHPAYAWSCPKHPGTGPFTVEVAEGQHQWYRRTDNREVEEAEPFPGVLPVTVGPEAFASAPTVAPQSEQRLASWPKCPFCKEWCYPFERAGERGWACDDPLWYIEWSTARPYWRAVHQVLDQEHRLIDHPRPDMDPRDGVKHTEAVPALQLWTARVPEAASSRT